MAWRASHYVVAGTLAAAGLLWAAHEAWSARRMVTARPLVVTEAYDDRADTLRARETLSDLLTRAGITGRDYVAFLGATKALDSRRLIAQGERLKELLCNSATHCPQTIVLRSRDSIASVFGGDASGGSLAQATLELVREIEARGLP